MRHHISFRHIVLLALVLTSTMALAYKQNVNHLSQDSLTVSSRSWNENPSGKMARSAYPVKLSVKGRNLRINSKHEQILPIYTQGGTLYLAIQLTPGVNWLYGLPQGRYHINNRTINIR